MSAPPETDLVVVKTLENINDLVKSIVKKWSVKHGHQPELSDGESRYLKQWEKQALDFVARGVPHLGILIVTNDAQTPSTYVFTREAYDKIKNHFNKVLAAPASDYEPSKHLPYLVSRPNLHVDKEFTTSYSFLMVQLWLVHLEQMYHWRVWDYKSKRATKNGTTLKKDRNTLVQVVNSAAHQVQTSELLQVTQAIEEIIGLEWHDFTLEGQEVILQELKALFEACNSKLANSTATTYPLCRSLRNILWQIVSANVVYDSAVGRDQKKPEPYLRYLAEMFHHHSHVFDGIKASSLAKPLSKRQTIVYNPAF